jgi:cytoskeletal protein CcmA (bactofilin family)
LTTALVDFHIAPHIHVRSEATGGDYFDWQPLPDGKKADLTIEGKISGTGHVRIAGKFKGDVHVEGNVTLDVGARLEGHVKASVVCVSGELIGNIENAKRVELLESGVINGDVKAGSLTVAAGSRMRGQVEFGYEGEARAAKTDSKGFGNA